MKNISINYIKSKLQLLLFLSLFNAILANGNGTSYFDRTATYFKMQKGILNPFYEEMKSLSLTSNYEHYYYYTINPFNKLNALKEDVESGLDNSFVFYKKYDDFDMTIPTVVSIDYYTEEKINRNKQKLFDDEIRNNFNSSNEEIKNRNKSSMISIIDRSLGNTNVSIDLQGSIQIDGDLKFKDQKGGSFNQENNNWALDIEQKQNFNLEGGIGEKFTVYADQKSDADFEWENALLLEYKGFDNEIVKEVSAGNISLHLPHTQLVSVGMGKREGLFGVKMENKFGNLTMNSIIGREKVNKQSISISANQGGTQLIPDYNFLYDKYFFVDKVFKYFFYPLSDTQPINLPEINTEYVILDFQLYKKNLSSEPSGIIGKAFLDPNNPQDIESESGQWIKLLGVHESGTDYEINKATGLLRLNTINSSDVVGVYYTIGRMVNNQIIQVNLESDYDGDGEIDRYNDTGTSVNVDVCVNTTGCNFESLQACDIVSLAEIENESYNCYDASNILFSEVDQITCQETDFLFWQPDCDYIDDNSNNEYDGDQLVLKLIKTQGSQTPNSLTWDLMLKNVYSLGSANISKENPPEIEIIHTGGNLGTETSSSNGNTFLNIFGLDNMDVNQEIIEGGDGKIDFGYYSGSSYIINEKYGDLFFPYYFPFSYDNVQNVDLRSGNNHEDLQNIIESELVVGGTENITFQLLNSQGNLGEVTLISNLYSDGPAMYFSNSASQKQQETEFSISVKNLSQNTTINLGWGIAENSETVTDGSSILEKGKDYTIDYFSGTLNLTSEKARNSIQSLTVSFDKNEFISFDQKIILGNYLKFDITENLNLFGGAYYYTQEISDTKVDIGYEPMENFIWHIGGKYNHEFNYLNSRVNANTNLNLKTPSKFEFLTEYAEINPNPNPLGVAYLDDFESSDRSTPIKEGFFSWKLSSPPISSNSIEYNNQNRMKLVWYNPINQISTKSIWPNKQVPANSTEQTLWLEIPNCSDLNGDNFYNCPSGNVDIDWWSGISSQFHEAERDLSEREYIDIWIKVEGSGSQDVDMHIDLGILNEDINANEKYDSEDSYDIVGISVGSGTLTFSEDVGIDACTDGTLRNEEGNWSNQNINLNYEDGWGGCLCDQYVHITGQNTSAPYSSCFTSSADTFNELYDMFCPEGHPDNLINCNANPLDPNGDNYSFNSQVEDYSFVNGTQGNLLENQSIDSEDNNDDDDIDYNNQYFSYTFNVNDPNLEIITTTILTTGWSLYRIPLSEFNMVYSETSVEPSWEEVHTARIWLSGNGTNDYGKIGIASMDIVGNDWKTLGVLDNIEITSVENEEDYINNENIRVEVINNHENEEYIQPGGYGGNNTQDQYGNELEAKEQSLVLTFERNYDCEGSSCNDVYGIDKNQSMFIKKIFGYSSLGVDKQNSFFAYDNMEMLFKANRNTMDTDFNGQITTDDDIYSNSWYDDSNGECVEQVELAFRLGKDDNYYEIRQPLNKDSGCVYTNPNDPNYCESNWDNLSINLGQLSKYKKNRNAKEYSDIGIDGCSDERETGLFDFVDGIIIPQCLDEGENFITLCNQCVSNGNISDDELCTNIDEKININFCDSNFDGYYSFSQGTHYGPNRSDPNGDNFLIPGEECCLRGQCTDKPICNSFREGIDCKKSNQALCNNEIPECPEVNQNINVDTMVISNLREIINNTNGWIDSACSSSLNNINDYSYQFIGTEENYQYNCMFNNNNWTSCTEITESDLLTYNNDCSDNLIGELILDYSGAYVQNDISPANNEQNNIWVWDENDLDNTNLDLSSVCGDCTQLSIKGDPAINRIEYIVVGVVNNMDEPVYGTVWLNELRMTGVRREKGKAFLANLKFNLGELFNFDLSYSNQEANYHKLERRISDGNNSVRYSASFGFSPHKFLKREFFEIPFNLHYTQNKSSPMYKTGQDIYLGNDIDAAPEDEITKSNKLSFSTSLKTHISDFNSNNLLFKYIVDNSFLKYQYSIDKSSNPTIKDKTITKKSITYDYSINYDKRNYWQPFKNLFEKENYKHDVDKFPIKYLKEIKVFYSPKIIDFDAYYTNDNTFTVKRDTYGGTITNQDNINLRRNFKTSYSLTENILFGYQVSTLNNLNEYNYNKILDLSNLFDLNFSPGVKKTYSESYSFNYNPNILDWLSPKFTYLPKYNWSLESIESNSASLTSDNDFTASFTFSFQKFIDLFYKVEETKKTTGRRNSRRRSSSSKSQEVKPFEINQPHFQTVLKFLRDISSKISSVSITYKYNTRNSFSNVDADFSPNYKFKLGLESIPASTDALYSVSSSSNNIGSYQNDFDQSLRFSTSIQVTETLSLTSLEFSIKTQESKNSLNGYNKNDSYSFFPIGAMGDEGIPMFSWSIRLSGIEKYGFLKYWFQSITFNHNYNGEKSETIVGTNFNFNNSGPENITYSRNFTPLVGFTLKPLNSKLNINYNYNNTLNIERTGNQTKRIASDNMSLKFSYTKKSGLNIPIFFFRDFEIENEINFMLTLESTKSNTDCAYIITKDLNDFVNLTFSNKYNIRPEFTYSFSKYVDGNFYLNYSISESQGSGETKETDIGFEVRIIFQSFN